jgi:hypothetical protein
VGREERTKEELEAKDNEELSSYVVSATCTPPTRSSGQVEVEVERRENKGA